MKKNLIAAFVLLQGALVEAAPGVLWASHAVTSEGDYIIQWETEHPDMRVDVFAMNENGEKAQQVADDETGSQVLVRRNDEVRSTAGFYVVVDGGPKDSREDGVHTQLRAQPLQSLSNFRDVGGYVNRAGQSVKWGRIYRSGAPVQLTEKDLNALDGFDIRYSIDLRSREEQELSPSQLAGPERSVISHDYSIEIMIPEGREVQELAQPGSGGYGDVILTELAPAYRAVFDSLLSDEGAVHYHCSAGQDRTGIMTALILAALDVPREQIIQDYHLSTPLRNSDYEVRGFDPAEHQDNLLVQLFSRARESGLSEPQPLYGEDGISILSATLDMIDSEWGSVHHYLEQVVGLTEQDFERLQSLYLE